MSFLYIKSENKYEKYYLHIRILQRTFNKNFNVDSRMTKKIFSLNKILNKSKHKKLFLYGTFSFKEDDTVLKINKNIENLYLDSFHPILSKKQLQFLFDSIEKSQINTLKLKNMNISDEFFSIFHLLKNNNTIISLYLSCNKLSSVSVLFIIRSLITNFTLKNLFIQENENIEDIYENEINMIFMYNYSILELKLNCSKIIETIIEKYLIRNKHNTKQKDQSLFESLLFIL